MTLWRRWGSFLAQLALPVLVGLLAAPRVEVGGTLLPWAPVMADLDVYLHTGQVVLSGGDIIAARAPGTGLAFVYPPFVALLCVPLALLPVTVAQLGWVLLCVLAVYAVLRRVGLSGAPLCGATAAVVWFVEPVHATIGFGQLGTLLVALVVLDLVPGPRLVPWLLPRPCPPGAARTAPRPGPPEASTAPSSAARPKAPEPRRWLPEGCWTGLAVALKLTPGLFLITLLLAGRRRAAAAVSVVAVATVVVGAAVFPSASVHFVSTLLGGDTRTTEGLYYLTNQSVLGAVTRLAGEGATSYGIALSALAALFGAWVAARAYRQGRVLLAVSVCGVATLLASPISWTHHFVWVIPLGAALLTGRFGRGASAWTPAASEPAPVTEPAPGRALRWTGWLFVGWVSAAIFLTLLPYGGDAELAYLPWQLAISVTTPVLGLAVLSAAGIDVLRRRGRTRSARSTEPAEQEVGHAVG